jgi:superfamily II DNA helicase RecQ
MAAHRLSKVQEVFGIEKLSPQQVKAIDGLKNGKDVFLSLRTGSGKSLCYMAFPMFCDEQLNTQYTMPQVLIISPLISIMKEQTDFLVSKGLTATYIGKDSSEDSRILDGKYQFIFSSPEAILQSDRWRNMLSSSKSFRLFVVDEAHTLVHWYVYSLENQS